MHWIGQNIRIFLLALALAVVVWVSAVSASDPDVTQLYPRPIALEIVGKDPGLVELGDIPKEIDLTLKAPQSVWNSLTANPQAIRAILDLSDLSSGDHTVPVQVQIDARPVQIVSVSPPSVPLTLDPLKTRTMPVNLIVNGEPSVGFKLDKPVIDPSTVVISGAQSLVDRASQVRTSINANNLRQDLDTTVPVVVLDQENRPLSGLTVSPDAVQVSQPVIQQGGYRDLAVKVVVAGQVASGYHLTNISVYPPVVTVFSSDPTVVGALPGYVETSALNLEGAKENIETRLALKLPPGISVVGDQSVQVEAGISPIQSSITLQNQTVEVTGLAPGFAAQVSPPTVDIILSGPLPVLEGLTPASVQVVIDLSGLPAGVHQVAPTVKIAIEGVVVESIIPATLEVTISAATPTPKP